MDTVRSQAGMLSMLTSQIDEISRMSEVKQKNRFNFSSKLDNCE
jgi:hypothetical protein